MLFAFTQDQAAINEAARAMLIDSCTPADLRRMMDGGEACDEARWRTICEMGLPGMLAPEAKGGMGLALVDFIAIAEAAGYVALPEPLVELAGVTIPFLANLADERGLLGSALGGSFIALGHPANRLIADADSAVALILAHGDDVHLVERADAALTRQESIDPFRRLFTVQWQPCPGTLVARNWGETASRGALLAAAQLIGLGQRAIDMATEYARIRTQFGKAIGSYQAVKHLLASAQVKIEFARPVVHAAAAELSCTANIAVQARVAHAKITAGAAADLALKAALQVHGAIGMTREADLHFFLKRGLALNRTWGDQAVHMATVLQRLAQLPSGPDTLFAAEIWADVRNGAL
jgi:alkylation response protein AidB-like acyl-CoA dehydrogenase